MLLGARGGGKLLTLNEVIPTPSGFKTMNEISVGDEVFAWDGSRTKVTGIPFLGEDICYEITLKDGRTITAGQDHLWTVMKHGTKRGLITISTKDMLKDYVRERKITDRNPSGKEYVYRIPVNGCVDFPKQDIDLDPYTLGIIIGNGGCTSCSKNKMQITINKIDYEILKSNIPYRISELKEGKHISLEFENIKDILTKYDLYGKYSYNKSIPKEYLFNDKETRLELLKGLIDSDGTVTKSRGTPSYTTTSEQLADNVCFLVRSLGYNCRKSKKENVGYKDKDGNFIHCRDCYNVYIYTDENISKLDRKNEKIVSRTSKYQRSKIDYTTIVDIKPIGIQYGKCISVEDDKHCFLAGDFIVTHNSYLTGVGVVLHEWLFDGARIYNKESIENPSVVEILVGAANTAKSKDILDKTELALNNLAGPGGYVKHPFYKEHMGTLKSNNMNNAFRNEYLKKVGGEWVKKGSMSNIKHVTFTITNPEAAAGTRPNIIVVEEVGLLENVLQVHASNEATMVTDGTNRFGTTIYIGTGGNMDKIVESEILFRDPEANTLLAFDDIYENSGKIGWFVPAYYMDGSYKDENGNTKIKEAIDHYMKRREVKRKAKSMKAIDGELTNYPLKPSEMFSSNNSNIFPINDLKERLIEIQTQSYKDEDKTLSCELGIDSSGKIFTYPVDSNKVIRNFPALKSMDLDGAIEIYEEPKRDSNGNIFSNRYYGGIDTYDDDKVVDTVSLGSIFIMDSWTRRIVAEYTGRRLTKDFYEITRRLTMYYNAISNYEQNKKGLFSYYEKMRSLYLLSETPKSLKDEAGSSIIRVGNRKYGTTTTTSVINYGINLILNWLLEDAYGEDANVSNVSKIKSKGLLEELIKYNPKHGNYDRIFSLIMLLILVEDRHRIISEQLNSIDKPEKLVEQDDFFNRNYNDKFNRKIFKF